MSVELDLARVVCRLDDLADGECRSFRVGEGDWPLSGFVVRRGAQVHGYHNRCPHAGHPLNLRPHEYLTPDRSLIVCHSHGALFEIASGHCVDGPCRGEALARVPLEITDGWVSVAGTVDAADYED